MADSLKFADVLLTEYSNAFVTIYDYGDGSTICDGTVRSLSRIMDFHSLRIRSIFVMELEDGSVQADIHICTKEGARKGGRKGGRR